MITAEIKKMPSADRMLLMEEIWDTLRHDVSEPESPVWHKKTIDDRCSKIKDGRAEFVSINDLKARTNK